MSLTNIDATGKVIDFGVMPYGRMLAIRLKASSGETLSAVDADAHDFFIDNMRAVLERAVTVFPELPEGIVLHKANPEVTTIATHIDAVAHTPRLTAVVTEVSQHDSTFDGDKFLEGVHTMGAAELKVFAYKLVDDIDFLPLLVIGEVLPISKELFALTDFIGRD